MWVLRQLARQQIRITDNQSDFWPNTIISKVVLDHMVAGWYGHRTPLREVPESDPPIEPTGRYLKGSFTLGSVVAASSGDTE